MTTITAILILSAPALALAIAGIVLSLTKAEGPV